MFQSEGTPVTETIHLFKTGFHWEIIAGAEDARLLIVLYWYLFENIRLL